MTYGDARHLTERQALALHIEAIVRETSFAELRRDIMSAAAEEALADPAIAEMVRLALRSRRDQTGHGLRLIAGEAS